jgi:hypothetical protein
MHGHGEENLDTGSRLARLETQMSAIVGNGQPGQLHELRKLVIWSVILSALALGSRALDIASAMLKH